MKQTKRILALVLSLMMVVSGIFFTTAMAEGEPYYVTHGIYTTAEGTALRIELYLRGVKSFGGNIALDIEGASEFEPAANFGETVEAAEGISLTLIENIEESVYLGEDRIAFSWFSSPVTSGVVDATAEDVLLATITYPLKTDADLDAYTSGDYSLVKEASDVSDIKTFKGKPARVMDTENNFHDGVVVEGFTVIGTSSSVKSKALTFTWDNDDKFEYVQIDLVDEDGNDMGSVTVPMDDGKYTWKDLTNGVEYTATITPVNLDGTGAAVEYGVPSYVTGLPKKSSSGVVVIGGTTEYDVVFEAGEGSFEDDKKSVTVEVEKGEKIATSKIPEVIAPEGKKFVGWTEDGETLINFSTYKISGDVKLTPVFEDEASADKNYHYAYINGYEDGTVKPGAQIKRSEAAAIIAKVSTDFNEKLEYKTELSDVKEGEWYAAYVGYCAEKGIITGYTDGTFRPNEFITRAEFTVMISRMLSLELDSTGSFPDTADHWANKYIMALQEASIVDGYTDGTFKPENDITRAEAVKIVNRAVERVPSKERLDQYVEDEGNPFKDLDEEFWGFYDVMEAAVPHEIITYHK